MYPNDNEVLIYGIILGIMIASLFWIILYSGLISYLIR